MLSAVDVTIDAITPDLTVHISLTTLQLPHDTGDGDDIKVINADAWKKIGSAFLPRTTSGDVASSARTGSGMGSGSSSGEGRDAIDDLWTSAASEIEADKQREIDRKADVSVVTTVLQSVCMALSASSMLTSPVLM